MTLDTRHYAWCSLGQLAAPPAGATTLADDHVQRKGVVTTRGTVILQGMHRPAAGTPVGLAYGNGVWIANVPRRLRVLSSFADPRRGITTVSVGCLLAYHENRRPPVENPKEAQQNSTLGSIFAISGGSGNSQVTHDATAYNSIREVAALPMRASLVIGTILDTLGLTAAGPVPFEIYRLVDEWDLSAGYVEELDRIVSSAGYFCRINDDEKVEFIDKGQELGTGSLILGSRIIDMQPVNAGDLPGDAVYAKYSAAKLATPDLSMDEIDEKERKRRNWEYERTDGERVQIIHTYTKPNGATVKEYEEFVDYSWSETKYDSKDRAIFRQEVKNGPTGETRTETRISYDLDSTSPREQWTWEYSPVADVATACGIESRLLWLQALGSDLSRTVHVSYEKKPTFVPYRGVVESTLTKTRQRVRYINTPFGSDVISRLREDLRPSELSIDNRNSPIWRIIIQASELVPYGGSVQIRTERDFGAQTRPPQQERNKQALKKDASEKVAKFVWAMGSSASQTAIELSPPYVSDDYTIVGGTANAPTYSTFHGNADQQALRYARIENRLLLGNRNGAGIQLAPIDMPAKPFSLFYIRANGVTGAYRTNGTTWTITANGNIVCSTDALFWGAVDGDPQAAFFPLPQGATTLPPEVVATGNANPAPANAIAPPAGFNPAAPDLAGLFAALPTTQAAVPRATVSPVQIITPWRETLQVAAGVQVGAVATVQRWLPKVVTAAAGVRVGAVSSVPDMAIGTGVAGAVGYPVTLDAGAFGGEMAVGTAEASAETFPVEIGQQAGPITGDVELQITPALAEVSATSVDTTVGLEGDVVVATSSAIASATGYPVDLVATDPPFWAETQLLLLMTGVNNSTVFTDSSKYNRTVQVFGDTKISTNLGDPAGYFDGSGDYLDATIPVIGTGDFTIEMFIRPSDFNFINKVLVYIGDFSSENAIDQRIGCLFMDTSSLIWREASGSEIGVYGALTVNTWQHVAIMRKNGVTRAYVNGFYAFNQASGFTNWNSGRIRIGGLQGSAPGRSYLGYMKQCRVTLAGRYPSEFGPPTAIAPNS